MPRKPDVDPETIRQVMSADPRPTPAGAAKIIARRLGKPVSANLICGAIRRHPEWGIKLDPKGGSKPALDYDCERALGPIQDKHKGDNPWIQLTAYERHRAGLIGPESGLAQKSTVYVMRRLDLGVVVDYHRSSGFYERVALPWEQGHYLKQPPPEFARLELETAISEEPPGERRRAWERWLDLDQAAYGLADRGRSLCRPSSPRCWPGPGWAAGSWPWRSGPTLPTPAGRSSIRWAGCWPSRWRSPGPVPGPCCSPC